MLDNLEYYIALKESDYTWKNAFFWGNCRLHYTTASKNNRFSHYTLFFIEAIPILGQITSIFEKLIISHLIKIRSSLSLNEKDFKKTDHKKTMGPAKVQPPIPTKFSLITSSADEIKKEMDSIFAIYGEGYKPKDTQLKNLKVYVRSPEYREHCKTARVYYNAAQLTVDDSKKIVHQREPVNIGMTQLYSIEKLEAKYQHQYSVFNTKKCLKKDGTPFQSLPHTIAIYSETKLWTVPGEKDAKEIACLSLPAPALDTSLQPHWKYYVKENGRLDRDKYEAEMKFLAKLVVKAILDNASAAFKGEGIKRVVIPRYGQASFLSGLTDANDRKFASGVYYNTLFREISDKYEQLKDKDIEIRISEYSKSFNEEIKNLFLKKFDSKRFHVIETPNTAFEKNAKKDHRVRIGLINGNILATAEVHDLIINPWDPHSIPGNGCEGDNSFDGAMGKGTGIPVVQLPWLNTYLYDDSHYSGV